MKTNQLITPNETTTRDVAKLIVMGWLASWFILWFLFRPVIFPSPVDVLNALPSLWNDDGLGPELFSSVRINMEALIVSILITFPLAYGSRIPIIKPLAAGAAKLRFLSPAAFFVPLLFLTGSGHQLKVAMLVTGEAFFLLTTMLGVVSDIPNDQFDDARTLRMDEWTATWYVVIRGTLHQAFSAIRDNAAMGWGMLMMVEGIVRSEGGIGVMLIDANKYRDFSAVYAISLVVLLIGWGQDYLLGYLRAVCCPYAVLRAAR
jgi:NitT/TauT family transport system permease protein